MLYRIMTENKNKKEVINLCNKRFKGFTVYEAMGYWRGRPEKSLIVEIIAKKIICKAEALARDIKKLNNQEAVLLETLRNNSWLI